MMRQEKNRIILLVGIVLGMSCLSCHAWADTQRGLNGLGQICQDDVEIITIENPSDEEGQTTE